MESVIQFSKWLEFMGYDLGDINFQDAVILHQNCKDLVKEAFNK